MTESKPFPGELGNLEPRDREVLIALFEQYLGTGEPVASGALAQQRSDGLSSASIRSILARLEARGFLEQPHTSAGRIPSLKGLRSYVQQLAPPGPLAVADEARLQQSLAGGEGPELLARACHFLSQMSSQVGLVGVAPWSDRGMRQVRFIRLADRRVLGVLVAVDGQVRERVTRLPEDYRQDDLDTAARYFNHHFSGWTMDRIRRELVRRVDEDREAYDQLLKRVLVLYHCGVLEMQDAGQIYLEGTPRLVALLHDHERLASILQTLHEREKLLALLTRMADQGDPVGGDVTLRVRIGLDEDDLPEMSLILARYTAPDHSEGAFAILGPTRMEYERALAAVAAVRDVFSRMLKEN